MRVNVYAEEMTNRVEIVEKTIDGEVFTGLRFYLELPVTVHDREGKPTEATIAGPFIHGPGDDDSAAVTFWGKSDLRGAMRLGLGLLDKHYKAKEAAAKSGAAP